MNYFQLRGEYVTLGQLLKLTGIVGSGGEAKLYLAEFEVRVNGIPEERRGRKLRSGDCIVASGADPITISNNVPSAQGDRIGDRNQ